LLVVAAFAWPSTTTQPRRELLRHRIIFYVRRRIPSREQNGNGFSFPFLKEGHSSLISSHEKNAFH